MREGKVAMKPHASPSVRLFARELGVDLAQVKGTGPKERITADDVRGVRQAGHRPVRLRCGRRAGAAPRRPAAPGWA